MARFFWWWLEAVMSAVPGRGGVSLLGSLQAFCLGLDFVERVQLLLHQLLISFQDLRFWCWSWSLVPYQLFSVSDDCVRGAKVQKRRAIFAGGG
jgi:hypothetical protein